MTEGRAEPSWQRPVSALVAAAAAMLDDAAVPDELASLRLVTGDRGDLAGAVARWSIPLPPYDSSCEAARTTLHHLASAVHMLLDDPYGRDLQGWASWTDTPVDDLAAELVMLAQELQACHAGGTAATLVADAGLGATAAEVLARVDAAAALDAAVTSGRLTGHDRAGPTDVTAPL